MDLKLYFEILKRRSLIIILVTALAVLVATLIGLMVPPIYTATSTLRVILDVGVTDFVYRDDQAARLLNTYQEIVLSQPLLVRSLDKISSRSADINLADLRDAVLVTNLPDTELITISVSDHDPQFTMNMANALAESLTEYPRNLYVGNGKSTLQIMEQQLVSMQNDLDENRQKLAVMVATNSPSAEIDNLKSQITFKENAYNTLLDRLELARLNEELRANSITILSPATLPLLPSNRMGLNQIALSVVIGLLGGVGLALLMENLDTRIYSAQQLEYLTNLPVFGVTPHGLVPPGSFEKLDSPPDIQALKEVYRVLIPNMKLFARRDTSLRSLLITSASPNEGKSMVAANLSQALAEQGRPTVLVEADLRHSSLAGIFSLDGEFGLSDLLNSAFLPNEMILPTVQANLFLVSGGKKVTNPTTLLASSTLNRFLDYLDERNQFIIVDSPAVLGMADALVLASRVNGVVMVVGQEVSSRDQVLAALHQLQAARGKLLGMIFVSKGKEITNRELLLALLRKVKSAFEFQFRRFADIKKRMADHGTSWPRSE